MIKGPFRASLDDFDSIAELANECFPFDRDNGGIVPRWPHCFFPKEEKIKNYFVMKDGSKVVSLVGYVDGDLKTGVGTVKSAGITVVSTWPTYRERGLMTKLLKQCITSMQEEGYALSDLAGDRQRYGHFGWERAGRQWRFQVTRRSLSDSKAAECHTVSPFNASKEETDAVIAIHEKEAMGLKRSRGLYEMLYGRVGRHLWLSRDDEGIDAYAMVDPREKEQVITEFGGSLVGTRSILGHLVENVGIEVLYINSPWQHPLNATFFSASSWWNVVCQRMVKIIDLEATLRGFASQLGRKYCNSGFRGSHTATFAIEGTEQQVEVEFSPDGVTVNKASGSSGSLKLSDRQMVRLLFGPGTPSTEFTLPPKARFLEPLLPLDFYIWENESV